MSSTPRFAHVDTKKPDGFYVEFTRVLVDDDSQTKPDEHDDGFWPSQDVEAAGYVPPDKFDEEQAKAEKRMADWNAGHWNFIGVRARALCLVVQNGTGTFINLDSAGTFGIESDAGEYLDEVYAQEIEELKAMIAAMQNPVYEKAA